ncbi:hypothetical protein OUZ56_011580 [Daphnia magna]|uniref:Reverse transcriptase domain-containing protein n=1 Tax=Daphnia magna TaxID=35525 RepID=A0ABQ9Z0H9_9CRUS|nr:hypothetical protein OUZ56_011580 [Daphnia magna]
MKHACYDEVSQLFIINAIVPVLDSSSGLESVKRLIHQDDWMVKLDLKDACLSVPATEKFSNLRIHIEINVQKAKKNLPTCPTNGANISQVNIV